MAQSPFEMLECLNSETQQRVWINLRAIASLTASCKAGSVITMLHGGTIKVTEDLHTLKTKIEKVLS